MSDYCIPPNDNYFHQRRGISQINSNCFRRLRFGGKNRREAAIFFKVKSPRSGEHFLGEKSSGWEKSLKKHWLEEVDIGPTGMEGS